jgi:hypothetical protein
MALYPASTNRKEESLQMKPLHLLALGTVLSASLIIAQAQTTPATSTTAPTATKTVKSKNKAKSSVGAAQPATSAAPTAAPVATSATAPVTKPSPAAKADSSKTPSATSSNIADAKAKGLVWVNLNTKVYHTSADKEYGTTKSGKFMTEADAKAAGARLAKK